MQRGTESQSAEQGGMGAPGALPGGAKGALSPSWALPRSSRVSLWTEGRGEEWLLFSTGPEAMARLPPRSAGRPGVRPGTVHRGTQTTRLEAAWPLRALRTCPFRPHPRHLHLPRRVPSEALLCPPQDPPAEHPAGTLLARLRL